MIQIDNITVGYSRTNIIIKDFSYTLEDNKIYGILGESGCGKTTLLRTISGLKKPYNGKILRDNKVIEKAGKNGIYMMHQNYTAFDWLTLLDNVLIARKIKQKVSGKDVKEAYSILERVGLLDHADKYPTEISGGQRQRLALARTLFAKPDVILMDEPLSALDESTRKSMQDLILKYHKEHKGIIVMVTHSSEEANRLCDSIITL